MFWLISLFENKRYQKDKKSHWMNPYLALVDLNGRFFGGREVGQIRLLYGNWNSRNITNRKVTSPIHKLPHTSSPQVQACFYNLERFHEGSLLDSFCHCVVWNILFVVRLDILESSFFKQSKMYSSAYHPQWKKW